MNALDRFSSLDETLASIKADHAQTLKEAQDGLLASRVELELTKAKMEAALLERDQYMRLATKLITQFGLVEKVFADAKALAEAYHAAEARQKQDQQETIVEEKSDAD